ncbi:hypothetical protein [Amycolatopsis solani]|uniref:hypothetical protein n=1 Tax=Amycolatopsis solani TaxID=3028615 RepID=UPI0025AF8BDE|nr:hypothetical protein [Amycolatopsis sp. MEP2-6]
MVGRVLDATAHPDEGPAGISLVRSDGRRVALVESTVGERRELGLSHLRRESDLRWTAPARWWWLVTVSDVRCLSRVREVFPVAARTCEAHGVTTPAGLPAPVTAAVPDLHWLVHRAPAQLVGHPGKLDEPATVSVTPGRGRAPADLATVAPALERWLMTGQAVRVLAKLARCRADERHLYLTVDYTGLAPDVFDALVRADGVPEEPLRERGAITHLWVAPVFGRRVLLWSHQDGWSRHEPYPAAVTG